MMRKLFRTLVVLVWACAQPKHIDHQFKTDEPSGTTAPGHPTPPLLSIRVKVGDSILGVEEQILNSGGETLSGVGLLSVFGSSYWYLLKDGTCLEVYTTKAEKSGDEVIRRLTLGESGRGYPGKLEWLQKHHEVAFVVLK
jgi:hypothetical protein